MARHKRNNIVYRNICANCGLEFQKSNWDTPPSVVENDWAKMLSDFQIQTDNLLMAKQLEIVLMDKQRNMAIVIDVVVSNDSNISRILSGLMEEHFTYVWCCIMWLWNNTTVPCTPKLSHCLCHV